MNAITARGFDGEILTPRDLVRVVGKTHPLNGGRIECRLPSGLTIAEILREALSNHPSLQARRDFIVWVDGHVIAEGNWHRVRVKAGATVTFTPRLQGGANIWRSILTIVVAIAAYTFAGPIAGTLTIAGFALTGTALAIATAVVAGGIMLAGTLAINALFPVRPPAPAENVNSASLNSIQGAQNQASPFGGIPVVLGRHRQSPYYAAKPFTEIVGDDQFLRLLFCLGYGPLQIEDIRIGETPLSAYVDYDIELKQGFDSDTAVSLVPSQVHEQPLSMALVGMAGSPILVTEDDCDEISVDVTAPQGIYYVNKENGNIENYGVYVFAYFRLVGEVDWTTGLEMRFSRSTSPTRRGARVAVARGKYEIRLIKFQAESGADNIKEEVIWTALRSFTNASPIAFPQPLALMALRIRATDQLSGVISALNCVTTSLVTAWDGASWVADTASQWPPDLFRHVLQGPANARRVQDAQIDLENLQEWWTYCVANGFKFNQVINSAGSVYDKLSDIAAAGRAVVTFIDGRWGVIWDRPDASIVQHFTPRNSWGFQGQKPYAQQPHGWRVSFIDETNGFAQDERIVYDDGYDETNATMFEGLQFPGVSDPDLIWKHGRFHIAQSRLRPEKISLSVGWEHLVCTRGDRVRVTHDVLLVGLASGRVKSVAGQVVTFDEQVIIEVGKTYAMQFRVAEDARIIDRAVDGATPPGEHFSLTLVGDLGGLAAGDLFGFGESERVSANYRVQSIKHQKDLIAMLTLVDDAPEIALADQGAIPEYDPHVTIPPDPLALPPRDLQYLEVIDGVGASVRALVRLTWQVPRFGRIVSFEVQMRDDNAAGAWITVDSVPAPRTQTDVPLIASGIWSFRVRCIFDDGSVSAWVSLLNLNVAGLSVAPGDVTNLHFRIVDGQTVLDWSIVADHRLLNYEIRKGTSWDTSLVVGDAVAQPPWPTTGDGTYHVRAYVLSPFGIRIYSADAATIAIADSILSRNIILSKDEQVDGWTGALDGGVVDGDFIRTDVALSISQPWASEIVTQLALEGLHIAIYVSGTVVDVGKPSECRFWTEFDASGVLQGADFLGTADFLASQDVLGSAPTRFIRAFPIWRFAADEGGEDVFAEADVFAPTDVFSADVSWGDWVAVTSGTRVSRFFEPGYVLITDQEITDATGTKFRWFVDVPDRTDDYTDLTVPDTGLAVTFYAGGYNADPTPGATSTAFNGGPNGSLVPHVQRAIVEGSDGDEVKITDLTLAGCTVHVVNAGGNVTRSGVNLLVRGY